MAFTKLEKDMNIIQKLDDEPNDVGGMTSAELKAKFDEGNNAMKEWINNVFIPEAEETLRLAKLESVPDHAARHAADGPDPVTPDMIGAASNPNLLDNSRWDHPDNIIDQRSGYVVVPGVNYYTVSWESVGLTDKYYTAKVVAVDHVEFEIDGTLYYAGADTVVRGYVSAGYNIARWYTSKGLIIMDDHVVLPAGSFFQRLETEVKEALDGRTITMSLCFLDGSIVFGSAVYHKAPSSNIVFFANNALTLLIGMDGNPYVIAKEQIGVLAAKLELGTTQTLAHQDADGNWVLNDPPPDKHLELLKCCMSTADPSDTYANNKLTPAAINAVNKAGDTMTGALYLDIAPSTYQKKFGHTGGSEMEYAQILSKRKEDATWVSLLVNGNIDAAVKDKLVLFDSNANWFPVYGKHNKPSGSYTGNGDATTRAIEIGGIGKACAIYATNHFSIVTAIGAYCFKNGGAPQFLPPETAKYVGGILTMATTADYLNASGWGYHYFDL